VAWSLPLNEEWANLSHAEAFRTLGLSLEVGGVRQIQLTVDPVGLVVRAAGAYGRREYRWSELDRQSRAQQAFRGARPAPEADLATPTRWSVLLRVVGRLLDTRQIRYCVVDATLPESDGLADCQVQVWVADRVVLNADAVRGYLCWLQARRIDVQQAATLPPSRPWWAVWRR
jgi:hypothetical protein